MKRYALMSLLISLGALASACNFFSQPVDLQTENLQNEQAQTQISAVRASATVFADRLQVTLENAQTEVGNIDLQSTRIASTLIANGMAFVDASGITAVVPTDVPQVVGSPIPQIANPLLTQGPPPVSGSGSASGDASLFQSTATLPLAQPTADSNTNNSSANSSGARLSSIVLTDKVGSNDCPVGSATSFSSSATDIYVTAIANNVTANSTLTADFTLGGQEMKTYTWSPGFDIKGACIWFHMPSSDVTFTPGNWSVALAIDGAAAGSANFSITGDTPNQINLTPGTGG